MPNNPKLLLRLLPCLLTILLTIPASGARIHREMAIGKFSSGSLEGWEVKSFHSQTQYSFTREGEQQVLHAVSRSAASGYYRKLEVTPTELPLLRWSWKIRSTVAGENARSKGGDDFAARVYLVFPSIFFWESRSIVYVWSGSLKKGESAPNPYSNRIMTVAVESGNDRAGSWVKEERNYLEDYRRLFGEDPNDLGAVAIMTDTDNTKGEAEAWYGDIILAPAMKKPNPTR